jgi:hypothetical protein
MKTQDAKANNQQSDFTENSEQNSDLPLTARARSLANLRHFQKGRSGNPGGRPKTLITDAYRRVAKKKYPNDPENRTYAQLVAEGQFRAAIKGKTEAAKEIAERLEGKVPQATHLSGGVDADGNSIPIPVSLDVHERLRAVLRRLRDRETDAGGSGSLSSGVSALRPINPAKR